MALQDLFIREADWLTDGKELSKIRHLVFIVEQEVSRKDEWDGRDKESWHWLASNSLHLNIGTCRLLPSGQIGRMAVIKEYRGFGVGTGLLKAAVIKAADLGFDKVYLHAQTHALEFYERLGFTKTGKEFLEAGIPHFCMTRDLSQRG